MENNISLRLLEVVKRVRIEVAIAEKNISEKPENEDVWTGLALGLRNQLEDLHYVITGEREPYIDIEGIYFNLVVKKDEEI